MTVLAFDSICLISILKFLKNFKFACNTNNIHEGTAEWLSHFFMNKSTSEFLNARFSADPTTKKLSRKRTDMSMYITV